MMPGWLPFAWLGAELWDCTRKHATELFGEPKVVSEERYGEKFRFGLIFVRRFQCFS